MKKRDYFNNLVLRGKWKNALALIYFSWIMELRSSAQSSQVLIYGFRVYGRLLTLYRKDNIYKRAKVSKDVFIIEC